MYIISLFLHFLLCSYISHISYSVPTKFHTPSTQQSSEDLLLSGLSKKNGAHYGHEKKKRQYYQIQRVRPENFPPQLLLRAHRTIIFLRQSPKTTLCCYRYYLCHPGYPFDFFAIYFLSE